MPRKYVRKKQRKTAPNPWLRRRSADPPDPIKGEPPVADFLRHEVPPFLVVALWVRENGIGRGAKISEHELAKSIYGIALVYRMCQQMEVREAENTSLKMNGQLPPAWAARLKMRSRGQPVKYGDFGLIAEAGGLLQRMKGGNQRIGWGYWNFKNRSRAKSELQLFVETLLKLIDPYRTDMPSARYYPRVKGGRGLVMPR